MNQRNSVALASVRPRTPWRSERRRRREVRFERSRRAEAMKEEKWFDKPD